MKVSILQQDLVLGLSFVSRFISSRPQLPILANILFSTEGGKLGLSATNLEMGIFYKIPAKIEKEGKTTIPAKIILELITNTPAGQISLEEKQGQVVVNAGSIISSSLATIPSNEFPLVPQGIQTPDLMLPKDIISKITSQVTFAAARDETRPVLTGVLLLLGEETRAVATDGFRLSSKIFNTQKNKQKQKKEPEKILIPARLLEETEKVVGDPQGEGIRAVILEKEGQIIFSWGPAVLTGKLIEGEFPNFERVIPTGWSHRALVAKEEFLRAIKAGAVFAREASGIIRLRIESGRLVVFAESQEFGKEEAHLDSKTDGGGVEVAFNYRYILDFLGSIKGEEVVFETEGQTSPGVFQDPKDPSYKHLIMPVRIQG